MHLGGEHECKHESIPSRPCRISYPNCVNKLDKNKSERFAVVVGVFLVRTDIRKPRSGHIVNLPEPEPSENEPILQIA